MEIGGLPLKLFMFELKMRDKQNCTQRNSERDETPELAQRLSLKIAIKIIIQNKNDEIEDETFRI